MKCSVKNESGAKGEDTASKGGDSTEGRGGSQREGTLTEKESAKEVSNADL